MRFTFEGYEGIAGVTTLNPATGLIVINVAPGCEQDVDHVLQDIQKHVYMEAVSPDDAAQLKPLGFKSIKPSRCRINLKPVF
ncbi:MAG: DUF4911 domain-containing protein [Actinobacteria bacterium]|nr:DUF4911 domain-containing protein [Actinomycetota bacterium]